MAAFFKNRFITNEEALLHVSDLSMQRGYAVFDFLRTVNGTPLFIDDHLNRFYASAEAIHLQLRISRDEIISVIRELIKRSGLTEAGIRMMLTGGYSPDSYTPAEPNLIITCNPVKTATAEDFEKGIAVITYPHQRELPHIKSINYLTAVWLQPLLKEKQADDVLYYNASSITEFPRSNIFIITTDNKLITPKLNVLSGVTRKNIVSIAASILPVEERDISTTELMQAAEVFLTSTTKKIMPVISIDQKIIGDGHPGPITRKLYQQFIAWEKNYLVNR
ncbi:MAG: aminotransferase class IV family protein [Sphingobacteriales bacterium]|nr:aminotransferase class IV family protein [Sphingobacteriales bacterium]